MSKKYWGYTGLFVVLFTLAGWLRFQYVEPVPRGLIGVWENETQILNAGPGEIRLDIAPDGAIAIQFDRSRYKWWGPDHLQVRVNGEIAEVWGESESRANFRIHLTNGRMRLSLPESTDPDEDLIFRLAQDH